MKKTLALICALVLICFVAATALAGCITHYYTKVYQTTKFYTTPIMTMCPNNTSVMHAHVKSCKDIITVYACPNCHDSYIDTKTVTISVTCSCAH